MQTRRTKKDRSPRRGLSTSAIKEKKSSSLKPFADSNPKPQGSEEKNHRCGHSYYGLSATDRVLKVVLDSEIELFPYTISQKAHVNHSTTRKYLRKLLEQGKIVQPYRGAYCSKIIHGMIRSPLRFHNIVLTSLVPWLSFSDDVVEWTGDVKVRVQFGLQRRKITGRIKCGSGMDKHATLFSLHRFFDIVKEKTGHDLEMVLVKTMETNRDIKGARIDGDIKCLTRQGLFGVVERIYQKEADVVRCELKITKPMRLEEFEVFLKGGVTAYNTEQGVFMLVQEVRKLTDAQKFGNEQLMKLGRIVEALLLAETRRQDKKDGVV